MRALVAAIEAVLGLVFAAAVGAAFAILLFSALTVFAAFLSLPRYL
jgi:hypothetical protein